MLFLLSNIPFAAAAGAPDTTNSGVSAVASRTAHNNSPSPEQNRWDSSLLFENGDGDNAPQNTTASLSVSKLTNGADGLRIPVLTPVVWSYTVTNTGSVPVSSITVMDSDLLIGLVGVIPLLNPQESITLYRSGLAMPGLYSNTGTAAGFYESAPGYTLPVAASDTSSYFGVAPCLVLDKRTNGDDGKYIEAGAVVTWTYTAENRGNIDLFNVIISDSDLGYIGTVASLPAGASVTLSRTGTAVAGHYGNIGYAKGFYCLSGDVLEPDCFDPCDPPPIVLAIGALDASCYFGSVPSISVDKTTNDFDGQYILTGAAVTWSYKVTNTGNVPLTNIRVDDSQAGPVGTITSLAPGESQTLTLSGTAIEGAYENTGTAVGTPPVGGDVKSSDDSGYYGIHPSLSVSKRTNGEDGASILVGDPVQWTYDVTNNGNVDLKSITVIDSDPAIGTVGTIASLSVGQTVTLSRTGTAAAGAYANTGTASCEYTLEQDAIELACIDPPHGCTPTPPVTPGPIQTTVSASDDSSYFGVSPSITLSKTTNGADGAMILKGSPIVWTYEVTNTGNSVLANVAVTDSDPAIGAVGTIASLAPGETKSLTVNGTAGSGAYENTATVRGTPEAGPDVQASDTSSYYGADPAVAISKTTNDLESGYFPVGTALTWKYTITNLGNIGIAGIKITDSMEGDVGTIASLAPGESATLTLSGTAVSGTYSNTGTVTAHYELLPAPASVQSRNLFLNDTETNQITASDESGYFGYSAGLTMEKTTNGDDGLTIAVGDSITWSYKVTNTGNVKVTNITVTDSDPEIGQVGTIDSLAPGETRTLTATGTATAGNYSNTGTVSGQPAGDDNTPIGDAITASDGSSYFGSGPAIDVTKTVQNITTAGAAGKAATGAPGDDFKFTIVVRNSGNKDLVQIRITDNKAAVGSEAIVDGTPKYWTSGDGGIATLELMGLTAGASTTITYILDTAAGDAAIVMLNVASVSGMDSSTEKVVSDSDVATLSTSSVLGAIRSTPTPTPNSSGVLGAARTGEDNGLTDWVGILLLLAATGLTLRLVTRKEEKSAHHK